MMGHDLRLDSVIEHRILVNFRADPAAAARLVPHPFEPELVDGSAIIGVCAVRLRAPRPAGTPALLPLTVDGAAHRIAVVHAETGERAVWVPVRHSSSRTAVVAGGRALAGVQRHARFTVRTGPDRLRVRVDAPDVAVAIDVAPSPTFASRAFADLERASRFFRDAPIAYSASRDPRRAEGLRLATEAWRIEPAAVTEVASSFLDALAGAVFDSALLMREVPARWSTAPPVELAGVTVTA